MSDKSIDVSHRPEGGSGRHERPDPPETFRDELRDAFAPRTVVLVVGVGLLCLAFVLSYLGAFHKPAPTEVPVAVVAPAAVAGQFVSGLNDIADKPIRATAVADEATARRQLVDGTASGVLIVNARGNTDTLLVASGGGAAIATVVERVVTQADAAQQRAVTVDDAVPHQPGDLQGSSVFYVVIGAILAGYLLAAVLGMARGARPATFRRTLWRLVAAVPYSLFVGLGVAVITGPVLGALTGQFWALFLVSALLTYTATAVTLGFQILFGIFGIAATIVVFVIVGNPSAGGAYPYRLLPGFWREIGPVLPNGAGVDLLRRVIYFDSADIVPRVLVLLVWAVAGTLLAVVADKLRFRQAGGHHENAAQTT